MAARGPASHVTGNEHIMGTLLIDKLLHATVRQGASDLHLAVGQPPVLRIHGRLQRLRTKVLEPEDTVALMKSIAPNRCQEELQEKGGADFGFAFGDLARFRVSIFRQKGNIGMVLRLIPLSMMSMEEMGLPEVCTKLLTRPRGLFLVTGPTGSGKTTTLASMIDYMNENFDHHIITIEDPIEYQIPGVNQTQVNEKAKLTFAGALRAILRQDPDVILVGEIRDQETAKIAMQAAQTGHLVLSTLHTDDAPSTVTRLTDMGMEPYVIGSALVGVIAQRLVRRLCGACRRQYTPEADTLRALNIAEADAPQFVFYRSVGCEECNHTGYRGRIAIYEVMRVSDKVRRLISQKAGEDMIREAAVSSGMITLGEDGLAKVKTGVTTAEELLRVVTEVREIRTLCPGCGGAVAMDFLACPHCGNRLSGGCPKCGRSLQPGWSFCPFCATTTAAPAKSKKKLRQQGKTLELPASNVTEFKNQNR